MKRLLSYTAVCLMVVATPALAGPDVLTQGADLWHTATGLSYSSFAENPIPAGFFCEGSKPFKGTVQLQGKPLATAPTNVLGNIDTIVRRLDDAVLDEKGEGSTRIQLLALSLASTKPIRTECGSYNVTASLAGKQPMTEMKLLRTAQEGGYYIAPLDLNVKMVFTPVSGKGETRELMQRIQLGPGSSSVWSSQPEKRAEKVKVDTDGDLVPDTYLPPPSNFKVGLAALQTGSTTIAQCYKIRQSCHCARYATDPYTGNSSCQHLHCVTVTLPCSWPDPPTPPPGVPYITFPDDDDIDPVEEEQEITPAEGTIGGGTVHN